MNHVKYASTLALFCLLGSSTYASSLAVYKDKTVYTYTPKSSFIGLTRSVTAKCEGETLDLHGITNCPSGIRLCKTLDKMKSTQRELKGLEAESEVLSSLITLPQPKTFDAENWIETAKSIGEEQAKLDESIQNSKEIFKIQNKTLKREAPAAMALVSERICSTEMELTLPANYVTFSNYYEAEITDKKEITVTQYLSLRNRSGIDIEAETAMFYYRYADQYVRPVSFSPWVIQENRPDEIMYKKMVNHSMSDASIQSVPKASGARNIKSHASYVDAREYKAENLELPSTGLPKAIPLMTWKSKLSCELKAYPYRSTHAFSVCSFVPKFQIDRNKWKITSNNTVINGNAAGEYKDGKYDLYTQIDSDIKIVRKAIVKSARNTGIFGTTVRKKDGFVLNLTNKSDKKKTLTLTDRIPVSQSDEIEVKLLEVKSSDTFKYTVKKEGEIEMHIALHPHENKKIEIFFEISYDKDLKITY